MEEGISFAEVLSLIYGKKKGRIAPPTTVKRVF
jgi:hypothetical protein